LRSGARWTRALSAPITQGSSITERDLAHQAQAAETVKYGPEAASLRENLGTATTRARDTGGFYDQYISQLAANRKAVADQNAATAAQLGQISSGITGLAGTEGAAMQQQANQRAGMQGVAQAGDLSQLASNAAATRQALVGSFQAQQAQQGAAANQYAGTLANVVGPGQKLAAQAQGQGKVAKAERDITDLATQRGAYNQQYRTEQRASEAKNVIARGALNLNAAKATADQALDTAKLTETKRANRADERAARDRIKATTQKALDAATRADSKTILSGAFAGRSASWLSTATDAQKQKLIDAYDAKHGGKPPKPPSATTKYEQDFFRKYGIKPAGTSEVNKAKSTIGEAKTWLSRMGGNLDEAGRNLSAGVPAGKNSDGSTRPPVPKLPAVLIRVAMDQKRMGGYISADTANRLHRSGYSVATLGLKTKPAGGRRPDTAGNPNVSR
jgi:hypothetical protein